ncbi:MAG: hypothetical protein IKD72_09485 [Clostridia bacterium]|nr:hypothetical protein [Clostridia bacterium]
MVYGLKTSAAQVVHTADCHYIAKHAQGDLVAYGSIVGAMQNGRRFCRHCNPVLQEYARNRLSFDRFCEDSGFHYRIDEMSIDLQTPTGAWKLTVGKENQSVLFHRNTESRSVDHLSTIKGYHLQRCPEKDLLSQLKYIYFHDCFRGENPYFPPKEKPVKKPAPSKKKKHAAKKDTLPIGMSKKKRKKMKEQQRERERRAKIRSVLDTIDALQMARRATA